MRQARARYPHRRPLLYAQIAALHDAGRHAGRRGAAGRAGAPAIRATRACTSCSRKTYAALGKRLLQHQAQAEVYVLQGSLPAAIEQLQLAQSAGDGDFYQLSVVDARLKELRAQHAQEMRDQKK